MALLLVIAGSTLQSKGLAATAIQERPASSSIANPAVQSRTTQDPQDTIQDVEAELERAIVKATRAIARSVVRLDTIGGASQVDGARFSSGPGTAIVVGDGYLLTSSYFLANDPASVIVKLADGQRVAAEVHARDKARNLTLLKVDVEVDWVVPTLVPRRSLAVGQTVIAIGKTIDGDVPQLSTGIVSATDRIWGKAIQTDAKISPANFGGPLLNLDGDVVGILTPLSTRSDSSVAGAEWYDSGIGFAVPVDEVVDRLKGLEKGGELLPGLIGVKFAGKNIYVDAAKVAFCLGTSPAAQAGIRVGDTIIECNGMPVTRQAQLKHALGPSYAGDQVDLKVKSASGVKMVAVKLAAKLPPFEPVGIGVAVDVQEAQVRVRQLEQGGPAEIAGLELGDVLISAAGQPIKQVLDLRMVIAATPEGESVKVAVDRFGASKEFDIEVQSRKASVPKSIDLEWIEGDCEVVPVDVAEDPNLCLAIVPPEAEAKPSLLVWIPPAGKVNREQALKRWGKVCADANTIVMIPQSNEEQRWDPQEVDFVVRAVNTLRKQTEFESERVVLGGKGAGGAFASLIAFRHSNLFQGLVLREATIAKTAPKIEASPVEPMMVLVSGDRFQKDQGSNWLRQAGIPVQAEPTLDLPAILRWVNLVDRL